MEDKEQAKVVVNEPIPSNQRLPNRRLNIVEIVSDSETVDKVGVNAKCVNPTKSIVFSHNSPRKLAEDNDQKVAVKSLGNDTERVSNERV